MTKTKDKPDLVKRGESNKNFISHLQAAITMALSEIAFYQNGEDGLYIGRLSDADQGYERKNVDIYILVDMKAPSTDTDVKVEYAIALKPLFWNIKDERASHEKRVRLTSYGKALQRLGDFESRDWKTFKSASKDTFFVGISRHQSISYNEGEEIDSCHYYYPSIAGNIKKVLEDL